MSYFHCDDCGEYFCQSSLLDPPLADAEEEMLEEEIMDLHVLAIMKPHMNWRNIGAYPRIIEEVREAAPDLEIAFRNDHERWTCTPAELDARVLDRLEEWITLSSAEESDEDDDEDLDDSDAEPIIPGEGGPDFHLFWMGDEYGD